MGKVQGDEAVHGMRKVPYLECVLQPVRQLNAHRGELQRDGSAHCTRQGRRHPAGQRAQQDLRHTHALVQSNGGTGAADAQQAELRGQGRDVGRGEAGMA